MKKGETALGIRLLPDINRGKRWGKKARAMVFSVFRILVLLAIGFVILYPLLYMVVTSLRTKNSFLNSARIWIPEEIAFLKNYSMAFDFLDYGNSMLSTLKLEVVSALIEVAACAVAAYGFSRFRFRGRKLLTAMLFLTILVPDTMIIIPRVVNYSHMDFLGILGLFNQLTGVDLRPNLLGTPFAFYFPSLLANGLRSGIMIFIYIQFFKNLPNELEEAAWIDGAGPFRTFISVAIPSSGVVILTVLVFSLIWHWNDYFLASMYMNKDYPLAVSLNMMPDLLTTQGYYIGASQAESMAFLMAACVMFVLPMLIVYMILQRWFIESIDRVGITG